jgi:hypothetical protein
MDDATLSAYDRAAKLFADDWDAQPPPIDLHAVVGQFFILRRIVVRRQSTEFQLQWRSMSIVK